MEGFIISLIISFSVFFFFILVVVRNLKKQSENARRTKKQKQTGQFYSEPEHEYFTEEQPSQEGVPTVKNVHKNAKAKQQPTTKVEPAEPFEDEEAADMLPDFTDDEEIRKAVIASEILNRKEY